MDAGVPAAFLWYHSVGRGVKEGSHCQLSPMKSTSWIKAFDAILRTWGKGEGFRCGHDAQKDDR